MYWYPLSHYHCTQRTYGNACRVTRNSSSSLNITTYFVCVCIVQFILYLVFIFLRLLFWPLNCLSFVDVPFVLASSNCSKRFCVKKNTRVWIPVLCCSVLFFLIIGYMYEIYVALKDEFIDTNILIFTKYPIFK